MADPGRHPRGRLLWPLLALPGVAWTALLLVAPLYVVLAILFGGVDPVLRQPVPVWNPVDWDVAQFRFVQPHPFVLVDVRRGSAAEQWHLELDNRWELADIGFTETTLKPGDRVVVTGSPARREPQRMYVRRLDRPADGFGYEQVGTRPRLRKAAR